MMRGEILNVTTVCGSKFDDAKLNSHTLHNTMMYPAKPCYPNMVSGVFYSRWQRQIYVLTRNIIDEVKDETNTSRNNEEAAS